MNKPSPTTQVDLLAVIDDVILAWATGEKEPRDKLIKARRMVGEVVASTDQLLIVLERQMKSLFQPIVNERELCALLRCHRSWLARERESGRWLNCEIDTRGRRFYTPEQILANLRGEKPKQSKLKETGTTTKLAA